ncbi:hypothetical protein PF001_g8350 [Phytophthora fragariae]|uniref:Uncharacterized protein n=1 Tax=Phytophthora fragariae TaxID=53985 RepID=A0A6A4E9A8_9STRA|nr:hypothetical protein PF001_g8350 [Phytophthora fragariae]
MLQVMPTRTAQDMHTHLGQCMAARSTVEGATPAEDWVLAPAQCSEVSPVCSVGFSLAKHFPIIQEDTTDTMKVAIILATLATEEARNSVATSNQLEMAH